MSVYDQLTFAPMLITDIFDEARQTPAWLNTNAVQKGTPQYAHVTNSGERNSVAGFICEQVVAPNTGNAITIGIDTQAVAYQSTPFYGATKVFELRSQSLNRENALVLVTLLRQAIEKFSWGYKASGQRLRRTRIMVPTTRDNRGDTVPDWDGMTSLGRELRNTAIESRQKVFRTNTFESEELPDLIFAPMAILDVFETMKSSKAVYDKNKLQYWKPTHPFLSQSYEHNGVSTFVPTQTRPPEPANCITVTLKTQATAYQIVPFYTAQNFLIFRHQKLNVDNGLVLVTAFKQLLSKFSWGYGVSMPRLEKSKIVIPVTLDNDGSSIPDWDGMSTYGRAMRVRVENTIRLTDSVQLPWANPSELTSSL